MISPPPPQAHPVQSPSTSTSTSTSTINIVPPPPHHSSDFEDEIDTYCSVCEKLILPVISSEDQLIGVDAVGDGGDRDRDGLMKSGKKKDGLGSGLGKGKKLKAGVVTWEGGGGGGLGKVPSGNGEGKRKVSKPTTTSSTTKPNLTHRSSSNLPPLYTKATITAKLALLPSGPVKPIRAIPSEPVRFGDGSGKERCNRDAIGDVNGDGKSNDGSSSGGLELKWNRALYCSLKCEEEDGKKWKEENKSWEEEEIKDGGSRLGNSISPLPYSWINPSLSQSSTYSKGIDHKTMDIDAKSDDAASSSSNFFNDEDETFSYFNMPFSRAGVTNGLIERERRRSSHSSAGVGGGGMVGNMWMKRANSNGLVPPNLGGTGHGNGNGNNNNATLSSSDSLNSLWSSSGSVYGIGRTYGEDLSEGSNRSSSFNGIGSGSSLSTGQSMTMTMTMNPTTTRQVFRGMTPLRPTSSRSVTSEPVSPGGGRMSSTSSVNSAGNNGNGNVNGQGRIPSKTHQSLSNGMPRIINTRSVPPIGMNTAHSSATVGTVLTSSSLRQSRNELGSSAPATTANSSFAGYDGNGFYGMHRTPSSSDVRNVAVSGDMASFTNSRKSHLFHMTERPGMSSVQLGHEVDSQGRAQSHRQLDHDDIANDENVNRFGKRRESAGDLSRMRGRGMFPSVSLKTGLTSNSSPEDATTTPTQSLVAKSRVRSNAGKRDQSLGAPRDITEKRSLSRESRDSDMTATSTDGESGSVGAMVFDQEENESVSRNKTIRKEGSNRYGKDEPDLDPNATARPRKTSLASYSRTGSSSRLNALGNLWLDSPTMAITIGDEIISRQPSLLPPPFCRSLSKSIDHSKQRFEESVPEVYKEQAYSTSLHTDTTRNLYNNNDNRRSYNLDRPKSTQAVPTTRASTQERPPFSPSGKVETSSTWSWDALESKGAKMYSLPIGALEGTGGGKQRNGVERGDGGGVKKDTGRLFYFHH